MDNKIEHFFVLKPDGKIGWIEKMPKEPIKRESFESYAGTVYMGGDFGYEKAHAKYQQALQSAIDNAVEVSNQKIVKYRLLLSGQHRTHGDEGELKLGTPYSLQCSVEKKEIHTGMVFVNSQTSGSITKTVALVTFSQPEREETQEQIFDDLFCQYLDCIYNKEMSGYTANIEIQRRFTITRKTP